MVRFYRWRCFRLVSTATRLVVLDKAMSEIQYSSPANVDALDSAERQIAAKYMRMVPCKAPEENGEAKWLVRDLHE